MTAVSAYRDRLILDHLPQIKYIAQRDWAPRSLRKLSKEVEEAYAQLEQRNGRPALDEEVAKELNMEIGEYYSALDQLQGLNLGCFEVTETEQDTDGDSVSLVPTSDGDSPLDVCRKGELKELLARFIDLLPDRERLIVTLYHYEELTMKEVGRILGVNESRISQLHTRALLRLRGKLHSVLRNRQGWPISGGPGSLVARATADWGIVSRTIA